MLPEQQQRILGYFLEEARDHLNTIEQGLLNLQSTLNDPEMINEVFRAAHSIKGGAAMLGLNSIQHTAHRLEDSFKVLKDNPVQVDENLESLFLDVSDTLKMLLEHLGGPFGLSEEAANTLMSKTEPVFRCLNEHLEELVEQSTGGAAITVSATAQLVSVNAGTTPNIGKEEVDKRRPSPKTSLNQNWGEFQGQVLQNLREMLQLFKQTTTPLTRQNLQQCCQQLVKLGTVYDLAHWSGLCQAAANAIANPDNSYLTLAKIVITEIKKAQELVLQGKETEIVISPQLNALLSFAELELLEITHEVVDEQPQPVEQTASTIEPATSDNGINSLFDHLNEDTDNLSSDQLEETPVTPLIFAAVPLFDHEEETLLNNSSIDTHGPVVGIAELNSLADLFESDSPELDATWHQEEILDTIAANQLGIGDSDIEDDDHELVDFLLPFDDDTSNDQRQTSTSSTEELNLLFGENFLDKENSEPPNQPISPTSIEIGDVTSSNLDIDLDFSPLDILEEFTVSPTDSQPSSVENDVLEDVLALTLNDNELLLTDEVTPPATENITSAELSSASQSSFDDLLSLNDNELLLTDEVTPPATENIASAELSSASQSSFDDLLSLNDNELLLTDEVTPPATENIASAELSSASQSSFDDLLSENTNIDSLEELTPPQPESSSLDNLFAEIEEKTSLPTDESEIGTLFDSPNATAADVSNTSEDELNNFWNQTDEVQPNKYDSVVEQDIARDLEESLFASAASGDIFADSHQSISSSTGSFEEDFDITFLQPEQPQELIFASEAGNNLFDDLVASDSTISPAIDDDEVSLQELRGFSQEPEALDFMPEFTSLAPETTAADSPVSTPLEVELFSTDTDEREDNLPLSFDATYIQPELTDADADELFGNVPDEREDNLPLSFDVTYIQPELTDADADELFGNVPDEREDNLPLSFDATYIQPELTDADADELFGNVPDEREDNLPLSFDATYIQPELTDADADELFGNVPDEREDNLPLSFDVTYIQPELTDADADELFGNVPDEREDNLPLSFDATYIQPELTDADADELFGNVPDEREDNLPLSFDVTYIQPELTDADADELFGNVPDEREDNLPLSFDATYIQPELTDADELFGNVPDEREDNLPLSFDVTYIQPELTDADADELFGNVPDEREDNLPLSFDVTYIQPELTDADADELFGADTELDVIESTQADPEIVDPKVSDTLADAFKFTEISVVETAQLSLVNGLSPLTETALSEVINEDELNDNTDSDVCPAVDELVDALTQEDAEIIADVIPDENEIDDLDEFAALEALLDEELAPMTNATDIAESDFAALEALLGTDNEQENAIPTDKQSSRTEPVLAQSHNDVASSVIKDEFDDLEKLLAEAGQTISHTPTVKSTTSKTTRSSNRRAARFEETMKVPVKQLDDMSNLVGELVVNRNTLEQDHERLRQSLDNLLVQVQHLSNVGARMQELYERSLLEASLLASRKPKDMGIPVPDANTDRGFSALEMDRFTPFHTLSQEMIEFIVRVRESASDIDFVTEETERVARQFRQVTTQLQEGLTRARMVPFSQAVDSKRRGVRDNAIKCGKQVELVIEGGDTLIDKMILDHLTDPLTHMLNNAIAHGIETPEVRQAAGKPPAGVITIRAFHQGNQTVISVGDDGAGIDPAKVKSKAIKTGTITPDQAKTISRLEIYDLLFQPGFSMKDRADELSGRGVGMDVVRSEISEIRGIVNTDSAIGKGTTFTIRLPLTLSICKALCCVSDKSRIAFPMDGVEDTLDIPTKNIQQNADGQSFIYWREIALPFRPLKELLTFNRQISRGNVYGGTRDDDMVSVVVVRSGNTMIALQIDQVLSEQEIVIKQFEGPAPKPIGVAGATVLGDGRIMPIADVLEIIDIFQGRMSIQIGGSAWQQKAAPPLPTPAEKIDPTVLIVDDSITVRELLSLTFNKAGYRVEQARDGQEAWDKLRSGLPCDIVFCDIEMPRCDGLELLSRIQKDSNLNHLPIAMLTSRGADRHRQMAVQLGASGYFTKPYLEEALLEAASRMLKGEKLMTTV